MRRSAVVTILLLWCASAAAQNPALPASSAQFIASRQAEVERLAKMLYATPLNDGTWTRHEVPSCGQLPHHAFARFDEAPVNGRSAHFLAIYDLDKPPARPVDKPWRGGILLVRVHPHSENRAASTPDEPSWIEAFNHVLQQERAAQPHGPTDNLATANCFLRLSGEEPMNTGTRPESAETWDATAGPLLAIVMPLTGDPAFVRTQYVKFDDRGLITEAGVNIQAASLQP